MLRQSLRVRLIIQEWAVLRNIRLSHCDMDHGLGDVEAGFVIAHKSAPARVIHPEVRSTPSGVARP